MSRVSVSKACCLTIVTALLSAAGAWAGDPIPEIDVVLEQIPGGVIAECASDCAGVDSIELDLGKGFAGDVSPARLPEGWSFEVVGSKVRLSGPPLDRPTRFKLDAGSAKRPEKISYQASQEGRKVLEQKNVKVTPVAPRAVIGSLKGIVEMPTEVAPGEPMQMTVLDSSALPPGGTWSLSGTVVDEAEEEDSEAAAPREPKRRLALVVADGDEVPDEALDDVAAVIATMGAPGESWEVVPIAEGDPLLDDPGAEVWMVAAAPGSPPTQSVVLKNPMQARHEIAMNVIRNLKAELAATAQAGSATGAYSVQPEGVGAATAVPVIVVTGVAIEIEKVNVTIDEEKIPLSVTTGGGEQADSPEEACKVRGGRWVVVKDGKGFCFERIEPDKCYLKLMDIPDVPFPKDLFDCPKDTVRVIRGRAGSEEPGGGRFVSFDLSGPPASVPSQPSVAEALAGPDGKVVFDSLPADLQPGGGVSMQYVDQFGDVVAEVPSVEGLEVVEPRGNGEARITDATPRSFAGQTVCVCGTYPGPAAWDGLLLDGQAVGSPASASGQIAWVQLPAGLAPGEHVFTGRAAAGFPAADRASTLVLQVGGEIDSSKLQRLETTPMRLWVIGTEEAVDLRVRNLTPAIISIEGGEDQTIRTSGGATNMLERTVRGLAPGAFDINYELAGQPCPCERQTHYY